MMKYFPKKYIKVWTLNTILLMSLTACNNLPSSPSSALPAAGTRTAVLNIKPQQNQKITLLLPMHGRYAGPSQAIRNGFLAAYDYDKKYRNIESQVNIVDTSGKAIVELYQKALTDGANVIVGPLTKEDVQIIAQLPEHPVSTLALNTLETATSNNAQFYQFGLSPSDEAQAVAQKAYSRGYRNAIILTPNTPWGKTLASALSRQWVATGGKVTDQLAFSGSMQQLSSEIPRLFKVADNKSSKSIPSAPSHRQDVDVILMATPSNNAKEIISLLKYNYLQNIPVYATSSVYSGHFNADQDQELNGIYFTDIPWLNTAQLPESLATIQRHSETLWPQNYRQYPRFYALGVDAYRLVSNTPGASNGGTGYLTLDRENKIHRKLIWFQVRNGMPAAISD